MFDFLKRFSFFIFLYELFLMSILNIESDEVVNSHNKFLYIFIIFIYMNIFFNVEEEKSSRLNLDLIYKYLYMFIKTPSFFFNYIINILKKIYIFLVYFKYRRFFNSVKILLRENFKNVFIMWRPLFKKTSYFGYYRSNRSKWIK